MTRLKYLLYQGFLAYLLLLTSSYAIVYVCYFCSFVCVCLNNYRCISAIIRLIFIKVSWKWWLCGRPKKRHISWPWKYRSRLQFVNSLYLGYFTTDFIHTFTSMMLLELATKLSVDLQNVCQGHVSQRVISQLLWKQLTPNFFSSRMMTPLPELSRLCAQALISLSYITASFRRHGCKNQPFICFYSSK